jgi:hypothetical protein
LTACGGSSKANTSATGAQGGGTTSSTAAKTGSGGSGSAGGGLKGSVNICSLMPPATLSQITGKQFDKTEEDNTASYQIYACDYTSSTQIGNQLRIDILGKDGAVGIDADVAAANQVKSSITALHPVSGIGDKAYGGGIEAHLEVLYGDTLIKISGGTDISTDQGKQIISQLHSKL